MLVTLATLRVKARLPTETSSSNVCVTTLQETFQQPLQLVLKTKQRETVALLWLHYVTRLVFKLSILLSSPLEHHRKYAFCLEEPQQSPKVRYLKNIAHMWNLHILLNQSMVKQTRKNASVYHVLNTTLSVLELNTRAVRLVRLLNELNIFRLDLHFSNNLSVFIIMVTFPEKRKAIII